jgi:hypothetical protein
MQTHRTMKYKPIPDSEKDKRPCMGHCYFISPVKPAFEIGQQVMIRDGNSGEIIDRGRNFLGNMYRVRVMQPIDGRSSRQFDVPEDDLFAV